MNKSSYPCNNCGKFGHSVHQCKLPITSYGVILFTRLNGECFYLMIRRRHSFGFMDFVRGNYSVYDLMRLRCILGEMSLEEHAKIRSLNYDNVMDGIRGDVLSSQRKFELLCKKREDGSASVLEELLESCPSMWKETEWEFPKGRKNTGERDLDCALREFEEETGISKENIQLLRNVFPMDESFEGTNGKQYSHKYFLAYTPTFLTGQIQTDEVNKMEWKSASQCLADIRSYSHAKKHIISAVNDALSSHLLNVC